MGDGERYGSRNAFTRVVDAAVMEQARGYARKAQMRVRGGHASVLEGACGRL